MMLTQPVTNITVTIDPQMFPLPSSTAPDRRQFGLTHLSYT